MIFKFFINTSKKKIERIINLIFYRNSRIFYGKFLGSFDLKHLILENIIKPGRSLTRLKHKRLFPMKFKINQYCTSISVSTSNRTKDSIIAEATEILNNNGAVVLDSYINKETIEKFKNIYKFDEFKDNAEIANKTQSTETLKWTKELFSLWFDELTLSIIEKYIGKTPYARGYPVMQFHKPLKKYSSKELNDNPDLSHLADRWHYDHQCIIQAAIYLDECYENGTRMQIIPGSNRLPNVGKDHYSDEYLADRKIPIINCFGGKGSIQIHCGNTVHKNYPVPNNNRSWIKFEFSSGNNILLDSTKIGESYDANFNTSHINEAQREMLRGLFPIPIYKGYVIDNNNLKEEKFKGV